MELNERKIRILEHIINDYIATAEPVGSRTIARRYETGLSPATIRNEMSDLEEMGYILAPHASAGRVPSDKGYRLYVDRLLRSRAGNGADTELGEEELRRLRGLVNENISKIDNLMRETAKLISVLTSYTAVISEAMPEEERMSHMQLMPLDDSSVLLVTVTASKKVRHYAIRAGQAPDYDILMKISYLLNAAFADKSAREITPSLVSQLSEAFGAYAALLPQIAAAAADTLGDGGSRRVYTSGMRNILAFPEFSDLDKARAIFQALEEGKYLAMLLQSVDSPVERDGIDVVIGRENSILELRDCSVIKTGYTLDGVVFGGIAIIGPTRMDYTQAVSVLAKIVKRLEDRD